MSSSDSSDSSFFSSFFSSSFSSAAAPPPPAALLLAATAPPMYMCKGHNEFEDVDLYNRAFLPAQSYALNQSWTTLWWYYILKNGWTTLKTLGSLHTLSLSERGGGGGGIGIDPKHRVYTHVCIYTTTTHKIGQSWAKRYKRGCLLLINPTPSKLNHTQLARLSSPYQKAWRPACPFPQQWPRWAPCPSART